MLIYVLKLSIWNKNEIGFYHCFIYSKNAVDSFYCREKHFSDLRVTFVDKFVYTAK